LRLPRRLVLSSLLLVWGVAIPATPQTSKAPPKKTATTPQSIPKKAAPAKKTAAAKQTTAARSKSAARRKAPPRPRIQQQPTPERSQEIQQALVDKGYLQEPPTGQWDAQSSEALKRFQADQQLQATGKLDSLSLIRLGLGPKRQALTPASLPNPPESTAKP
jgi:peptidoglycan hydrolase-like protein with peptidoglycan-binding domain